VWGEIRLGEKWEGKRKTQKNKFGNGGKGKRGTQGVKGFSEQHEEMDAIQKKVCVRVRQGEKGRHCAKLSKHRKGHIDRKKSLRGKGATKDKRKGGVLWLVQG